jgi:hypothetical protein
LSSNHRGIDLILQGRKTWEIRGKNTAQRGRIGLIKSKSGCVIGTCRLVDCIGPLSLATLRETTGKHHIPLDTLTELPYEKTYAWVMAEPKLLVPPVPYKHPSGAVIWVRLTAANVPNRFSEIE